MLLSLSVSAENREKSKEEQEQDYDTCVISTPCPHDNESLSKLPEKERKEAYICRVKRHIECTVPKKEEE